ncbi:MAG: UDP-N-acetylmuramoyl-tripeptide--D-alanyl-D-alanine ligase [Niabella sp.]
MKPEELYKIYLQYPSIQTDTRKLKTGDLFFALKGPNFNGNIFAKQALDEGAGYAVIDEREFEIPGKTILVADVLTALQQLANHHRRQFNIPFIAITGSNGKTTTKELIHAVLSEKYKVYTTEGNLNNHIGIPLTILKIQKDAEIAVIEMGANHLHEIESYCKIAAPTHGLITNCGKAHLEGFGSIEGVRKGKGELFDYLRARNDATVFIMKDYDYLQQMSKGISRIVSYGASDADITGNIARDSSTLLKVLVHIQSSAAEIKTNLVGDYNLPNVLAAAAVGNEFNISLDNIRSAIENYQPSNSRSQLIESGTNKIILDAYNANPSSMKLAIDNFAKVNAAHKILMLGAMAEMGAETATEHNTLITQIKNYNWDEVVLVGKPFATFSNEFIYFEDSAEAADWAQQQSFTNTYLLIKGSRSSRMEKIVTAIVNR